MAQMEQLGFENLSELTGGRASAVFDAHLKRAALDCIDRPNDGKPRIVTLQVELTPDFDPKTAGDADTCDAVNIQVKAASKVPAHKTKIFNARAKRSGQLLFNPDSTDNADQKTIMD